MRTKADKLLLLAIFFVFGIFLRSFIDIPDLVWWFGLSTAVSLVGAAFIFLATKQKGAGRVVFVLFIILAGTLLGTWRLDSTLSREDPLKDLRDTGQSVEIEGIVFREPDIRSDNIKYTIKVSDSDTLVLITTDRYPRYNYKEKLKITGQLLTPTEFPDFNYREFLEKDGIYSVMYYPEIEFLEEREGGVVYASILNVKDTLRGSLSKSLPYPQSELLGAMVLGDKQLLPENLKESFNQTGIRHITAISGMHITIIASLLMTFFAFGTRLGKNRAFYLVLTSLGLYVALVGFPPSAVRAGIMASIVLLAEKTGRDYFAPRALILAAVGMLLFNPMLLRFDVGFQLSFLAVLGILYISPFFNLVFDKFIKSPKMEWFNKLLSMTLGAQISTLPILIYNFGLFSGSAPIVNILIVPLLPFVIGLGFTGIVSGVISQTLGIIASFPAYLLLSYIILVSEFFENLAISGVEVENFHYSLIILFYLILTGVVWFLRRKFYVADTKILPSFFTENTNKKQS